MSKCNSTTKSATDDITGEWAVECNAENRPIRWTQGNKVITMGFDRMGRRTFYKEMEGNRQITHTVSLYDGYLCIQQLFSNSPWNVYKEFIWDPTEPLATRPLCFRQYGQRSAFLLHDGNKNVTDVVTVGPFNEPVAHYDYAPFGAVTATGARALANHAPTSESEVGNPFRFSSEFHDDTLALAYYNYRHYNPKDGRWLGRDPAENFPSQVIFCGNNPAFIDMLGLWTASIGGDGDDRGMRTRGSLVGVGYAVDWNLEWGLSFSLEESAEDPCVLEGMGEFSLGGEIGLTGGFSKLFYIWKFNVTGLAGVRGFAGLQAATQMELKYHLCNGPEDFSTTLSATGYAGIEGGLLARYSWGASNKWREAGAGVRGTITASADISLFCSGDSCSVNVGYGLNSIEASAFLNLPFGISGTVPLFSKSDFDALRKEESMSFANPLAGLLKK